MPKDGDPGSQSHYRFADFEFFGESGELRHRGHDLQLPYQAGKVLNALLNAGGTVVTRDQLQQTLWPDRSFGDFVGGLNTAVLKLGQVLADDGAEPRIIGTLPKRGYRLLVPVEQTTTPIPASPDPVEIKRHVPSNGETSGPTASAQLEIPSADPGLPECLDPDQLRPGGKEAVAEHSDAVSGKPRHSGHRAARSTAYVLLLALTVGTIGILTNHDFRLRARLMAHRGASPLYRMTGRVIRNPLGMEFVRIPAGSFIMGNDSWQREMRPAHDVIITKPFMLQTTEVTVGQFKAFVEATGYRTDAEFSDGSKVFKGPQSTAVGLSPWEKRQDANWRNPYYFQDDDCPVVAVDWNDIQAFIAWLNQAETGKGYRLPTEAEWEYASRGGAKDAWLGDPDDQAWHAGNSGSHAHAVGRRLPNPYGLHDMLGNVWEWCQDWYAVPFAGPFPRVDPGGPGEGDKKVIKGASWATTRTHVQWSSREEIGRAHV
jgi:formylglycine-generating enzyme required for sulfatase activity/DNA-binding winged helix-turn-helix (wHTH) protein